METKWLKGWEYRRYKLCKRPNMQKWTEKWPFSVNICHADCNNHCQPNFQDLRFTANDGITLIPWLVVIGNDSRSVWGFVGVDFGNQDRTTIYMYYGNPSAELLRKYGDLEEYGLYRFGEGISEWLKS